jgi:CRISPR/Cas system CSM-associated protein Csm3 (group 7 of RAMP superfamily)
MPESEHRYSLAFSVPVSIFTGLGIAGLIDRTVVRDADALPYIPGSSVKGRLRFFAERLLRSGSPPADYRLHAPDQPSCKAVHTACTLCRLFGNPSIPALLRIGQASLAPPWDDHFRQILKINANPVVHPDVEVRPGIALSRLRRTALPDHLFFDEAVPAITFVGRLFLDSQVTPQETRFLIQVGTLVDALGARKTAGRGALEGGIRIEEAQA